jgi:hypothetical protein
MNEAMRSIAEEMRWAIAILACFLVPVIGTWAGYVLTAILTFRILGADVDGAFNLLFLAPIGALTGLGVGVLIGSKFIRWARDSEVHR